MGWALSGHGIEQYVETNSMRSAPARLRFQKPDRHHPLRLVRCVGEHWPRAVGVEHMDGLNARRYGDGRYDLLKVGYDFDLSDLRRLVGNAGEPERRPADLECLAIEVHRPGDVGRLDLRGRAEVDAHDRVSVDDVGAGVCKTVIVEKAPFGELEQRRNVE